MLHSLSGGGAFAHASTCQVNRERAEPVHAVFAGLYQAHARELRGFACRRVGRQEAEDIVQEVYLHLLQKGETASLSSPRAYLFRMAANLAIDSARKTRTRSRYAEEELAFLDCSAPATPDAIVESSLELRRVSAFLEELPALRRKAFLLNRVDELSHAEIAERLGVSIRTVERHMAEALKQLSSRLGRSATPPAARRRCLRGTRNRAAD